MIIKRLLTLFFSIVPIVALLGCASKGETYKFYSGEEHTADELAQLVPSSKTHFSIPFKNTYVYLIEIDGKLTEEGMLTEDGKLPEGYSSIPTYEILPGEHKLRLGFLIMRSDATFIGEDPAYMVFNAESGHTYAAKGKFPWLIFPGGSEIGFWLEDINTKEVVAGTKEPNLLIRHRWLPYGWEQ
jgi:hypothetical protein